MKVLFIKDLRGQGKKGDIKEVKDGYAENYLIKNGYAKKLTEQNYKGYLETRKEEKAIDEENRKNAQLLKDKIEKMEISFKVKTAAQDKVFGSISSKQIKDEFEKNKLYIDNRQIMLEAGLSTLGYHNVKIELYKDIIGVVKVKLEK